MEKRLSLIIPALAMCLVMAPVPADATHPPVAALCVGGEADGTFESQALNTGGLTQPIIGLGLSLGSCLVLNPDGVSTLLAGLAEDAQGIEPSGEPPTPEEIQELVDTLAGIDYSSPLAALLVLNAFCQVEPAICDVTGLALNNAAIPLTDVNYDLQGSCFSGLQSGTGTLGNVFNYSDRQSLDFGVDYQAGLGIIGVMSGTATNTQFNSPNQGDVSALNGLYLPFCGSGAKATLLLVN